MHIQRSERSGLRLDVVGDCSGGSGLSLDTTRVCLGPLGCHGYDTITLRIVSRGEVKAHVKSLSKRPEKVGHKLSTLVGCDMGQYTMFVLREHME